MTEPNTVDYSKYLETNEEARKLAANGTLLTENHLMVQMIYTAGAPLFAGADAPIHAEITFFTYNVVNGEPEDTPFDVFTATGAPAQCYNQAAIRVCKQLFD